MHGGEEEDFWGFSYSFVVCKNRIRAYRSGRSQQVSGSALTVGGTGSKIVPRLDHGLAQQVVVVPSRRGLFLQFLVQELFQPHVWKEENWIMKS